LSSIDIRHPHTRTPDQVRVVLQTVADKLRQRHGLTSQWEGDALTLSGPGIDGRISLEPEQVRVTAELGFLMSAMKGMIESEIQRVLQEQLG